MVGYFWGAIEKKGGEKKMQKKEKPFFTVDEVSAITGLGTAFIKGAIKQGTFPGSYMEGGAKTTYRIPKGALEDYMTKFRRSPSDELIDCLILAYQSSKKRKASKRKER